MQDGGEQGVVLPAQLLRDRRLRRQAGEADLHVVVQQCQQRGDEMENTGLWVASAIARWKATSLRICAWRSLPL